VIRLVEEAEASRADVQRLANRFPSYFLPVVAEIAAFSYIIGRDLLATAVVLVVTCSCSFALFVWSVWLGLLASLRVVSGTSNLTYQ
jgi:P-type Cu+ transporter